ncbi:hypothetical protein BKA69DRAFT_1091066 [Paraphysoderma sedebokerense]|nr:hypothetical protein BKA69DRAFT_1091066 [Paraphysoderma sedebokerense]
MSPVDTDSHPPVCCLCPCIKSESKIYVKLPKSGYVPGETINIDAQVKNASRFFTLKNISFRLHKRTIFKADGGRTRAAYANVVTSSEMSDVVPPKKKASVVYALTIPESTLPMIRSDFITTDYFLTVSAKPDFFLLCTLTMDTDIKIGTTGSSEKKSEAKPVEIAKTVAHEEHH